MFCAFLALTSHIYMAIRDSVLLCNNRHLSASIAFHVFSVLKLLYWRNNWLHLIFTNISDFGVGFLSQKFHLHVKMFLHWRTECFVFTQSSFLQVIMLEDIRVHWKVKMSMKVKVIHRWGFFCYFIEIKLLSKLKMYWGKNMNVTSIPFTWAQWIPLSAVLRPGGKFNTFWIRLGFLCWTESCINSLVMSLRITLSHSLIKQGFLKAWTCPRLNVFLSSRPPSGLVPIPSRYFRLFGIPLQKSLYVPP